MSAVNYPIEFQLQWGHDEFAVEHRERFLNPLHREAGFNGATTNSPWSTLTLKTMLPPAGKLQWGHDEFAVEHYSLSSFRDVLLRLQWGHDEFAVEHLGIEQDRTLQLKASMGPRRIRRGAPGQFYTG